MKENINSFSFRRVGLLIKRDVVENWKIFLYGCLIIPVAFLWFLYDGVERFEQRKYYVDLYGRYVSDVMDDWEIAVFILLFLSASLVMACMNTKEGRTNMLMLPASNSVVGVFAGHPFGRRNSYVSVSFVGVLSRRVRSASAKSASRIVGDEGVSFLLS